MPTTIDREEVRRLLGNGAQLVEMLRGEQYEEQHLPRAISLPLRRIAAEATTVLDRNRPVIV